MCLLAAHLLQCLSRLCLHSESGLLLSCFYISSLWPRRFLWGGRRWEEFAPSSLCVWSYMPWRSRQMILLPQGFFARTPKIQRIVKICDVVDRFHRKPFWYITIGSQLYHWNLPLYYNSRCIILLETAQISLTLSPHPSLSCMFYLLRGTVIFTPIVAYGTRCRVPSVIWYLRKSQQIYEYLVLLFSKIGGIVLTENLNVKYMI